VTSPNPVFWEDSYKSGNSPDAFFDGRPSNSIVRVVPLLPKGAAVVDLGCGDGRNALYLAEQGFQVWAVDISAAGIEKLNRVAQARRVSVTTEVCDMRAYRFPRQFDLVVCSGCLHFMGRDDWKDVLANIQANTAAGGYNIITVFTDEISPPDDLREYAIGLFHEGELFTYYSDWTAVSTDSRIFKDEHPGDLKHTHAANWITAQKS
jgi:tellurite methyltransferase